MDTKSLLYGLIGFMVGGLLVSSVATWEGKDSDAISMNDMTKSLASKTGDDFDYAFIQYMIEHHQSAVAMAKLSDTRAKHQELKELSKNIIGAQESEIAQMNNWLEDWDYIDNPRPTHTVH